MDAWPWQAMENEIKVQKDIDIEMGEIYRRICDHFYGHGLNITSIWMKKCFTPNALARGGIDILLQFSNCEYCKKYVGPNPIQRKLFNIAVISGYCTKHYDTTTPDFRCTDIDFDPFWKQVISCKMVKLNIPEHQEKYLKFFLSSKYDEKTEILEEFNERLVNSGYYDEY